MGASAGREQMLTGTQGKVAFPFPHFLLNRISDQGHKHWFAFCWNSAFSFKFSSMILSLGTFHLSFPGHSTCLSQNACASATEWGQNVLCAVTEIQAIPQLGASRAVSPFPGSGQVSGKDLIGFSVASYTGLVPWSTRWRVHGILWDTGSVYRRLEIVQPSSET